MASYILGLLAVAGLSQVTAAQDNITSDAYFYGQSPAVYPSPPTTGTGAWADAVQKAQAFVGQLTQEEKSNLTCGGPITTGCGGMISAIPRMGFQGMCMQDGAHGVHSADFVNSYASGISVGASWNSELAYQRGYFMGGEFRTKGANVMLGPVVGPLGRVAVGGRNWEGFSNDPYLSGALAAATVEAVQGRGVITSTKHFIGNEQETNRNPTNPDGVTVSAGTTNFTDTIASVSSNIDDRTLHELYLWPFADAVRAGTGNIMASYNRLNNSYATQNSKILNGLLKTELGFQGFVISDWDAQHTGVASALAGLDMAMPSCYDYWGSSLTASIDNGTMPQSRLDDMATRIIAAWYLAEQDKNYTEPGVGLVQDFTQPHKSVNAKVPAAKPVVLSGAIEGHVLVKNIRNALPLSKPQLLSLFGYDALVSAQNNPSIYFEDGFESAQDTITAAARALGINLGNATLSQIADGGTLVLGGGSGANSPSYISAPYDAIVARAYDDDTSVFWDANTTAPTVDASSDACLVFINAFSTEGTDRTGLHDDYSDALVKNTASVCNNTIVVIHNAGIRLVDQWADHENVTAIIFGHLPGQDSGRALVSLLYGDVSFSGKLPYTVPKNESDFGPLESPSLPDSHTLFPQSDFDEGLYIDYRRFDALNITPRYEFGFGLSYTTFNYTNITVSKVGANTAPYPTTPIASGGRPDLWDAIASVDALVQNTGSMDAQEVAQLYVEIPVPKTPKRQLRGFSKINIPKGTSQNFHFDLTRKDLSIWDTKAQEWKLSSGDYRIFVGASSRILPLEGTLTI